MHFPASCVFSAECNLCTATDFVNRTAESAEKGGFTYYRYIYMQEEKREAMYNGLVGSLKPKEKRHFKLWKCVLTHGLLQLHSIYEYEDVETNISFFWSKMCLQPLRIKLNFPIVLTAPNFYTLCFGTVVLTLLCDIIRLWMHFFDKKSNTPDKIQRSDTHNNDVAELEMEKRSREGKNQTEKNRGLPPPPPILSTSKWNTRV